LPQHAAFKVKVLLAFIASQQVVDVQSCKTTIIEKKDIINICKRWLAHIDFLVNHIRNCRYWVIDLRRAMLWRRPCNEGWGSGMNNGLNGMALAAIVGLAAVGFIDVGPGRAADMAVKAPLLKAGAAPYNWSGCYVGGYIGWAIANELKSTDLNNYSSGSVSPWDFSLNTSALGGGTVGCNWQANNWLVLGIEGEGGYLDLNGPGLQPVAGNVTDASKIGSGYGVIAGRFGVAFDRLLLYGKVGVAFYDTSTTITDANNPGFTATGLTHPLIF